MIIAVIEAPTNANQANPIVIVVEFIEPSRAG